MFEAQEINKDIRSTPFFIDIHQEEDLSLHYFNLKETANRTPNTPKIAPTFYNEGYLFFDKKNAYLCRVGWGSYIKITLETIPTRSSFLNIISYINSISSELYIHGFNDGVDHAKAKLNRWVNSRNSCKVQPEHPRGKRQRVA